VRFDEKHNEYYLDLRLRKGTTLSLNAYHCPICGGVASESKRADVFATLSDDELRRVNALISNLATVEDIERSLGAPDREDSIRLPQDFGLARPRTGERESGRIRVLTYTRLSETADVQFTVYSNGELQRVTTPKYVGPPVTTEDSKRRRRSSRAREPRRRRA
jgi:hypothetical protein